MLINQISVYINVRLIPAILLGVKPGIWPTKHGLHQGRTREGRLGPSPPLKPKKVAFITNILYNSENTIRDIRPFRHPLFCHSSAVKYTSCVLQ